MGADRAEPEVGVLFRQFLAERWAGGPPFRVWLEAHREHGAELERLHAKWVGELEQEMKERPLSDDGILAAAAHAPGETFGGYRLLERIGGGGMGEVWEAEETALRRRVALKLLRPDLVADARALERFRREALAAAHIQHSGVIAVYAVGRIRGQPFIAQEFVPGRRTLASWIADSRETRRRDPERFVRAAELVLQCTDALATVHEAGTVHRDIKPANLLLASGDRVKVADFGLARLASEDPLSRSGDLLGTWSYMSPEQVQGDPSALGPATDVFSLGTTLYELLTFQRPFNGDSMHVIARRILYEDPPDPCRLAPGLPRELALICSKALEKRPRDRYASMRAFGDDLRRYLEGKPILARPTSLSSRALKWCRRNRTFSVAGGIGVVALAGIVWLAAANAATARAHVRAERDSLHAKAQYAIEVDDLERARELVARASELDPADPTGHMVLAAGYARYSRTKEAEAELDAALAKGFRPDPAGLSSALEHAAYGIYLQSRRDFSRYAEAGEHVRRAMELDPTMHALSLTLYQLRLAVGDVAGARRELEEYRQHLATGDPFYAVISALDQELSGDNAGAVATLEALRERPEIDEPRLVELRWHRSLGRNLFATGDLPRAEELLRRAVAEYPRDCSSWDTLSLVYLRRFQRGEHTTAILDEMESLARKAQDCSRSLENPPFVLAFVAIERCDLTMNGPSREGALFSAARTAMDEARARRGAADTELGKLEAHLLCLEARDPLASSDYAVAFQLYSAALERDAGNLEAAVMVGESAWYLKEYREGLAALAHALALWDDPAWDRDREDRWLGAILAWTLGNAGDGGDADAYGAARERLVRELEAKRAFAAPELLSAAEFLAKAREGMRDCELALALIEEHELERSFAGHPKSASAAGILREIESVCR